MEADDTQIQATDAGARSENAARQHPGPDRFVGHANLMSGLTIISRFTGLLRDKTCSYFLGVGTDWSAFWMGFQFPNLFRRVFGEGALTAVFVPVYTEVLHKQGRDAANRLASATISALVLVLTAITLLGEAVLLPLAFSNILQPDNALAALMIALMLPYCIMVCLVAIMSAIATVHEKFVAQSLSPIILNVFMAAAAALTVLLLSTGYSLGERIVWVAASVIAAGIAQFLQMAATLRRNGVTLSPVLAFRAAGLGDVMKPLLPIVIGYSAVQINVFLDTQIAWWLSPDGHAGNAHFFLFGHVLPVAMQAGAVGKLSIAQRIYLLPVGIFGVSMATAIFPPMARAAAAGDREELKRLLITGLRKTLFLSIPASFGMILIAKPLITLIYLGGKVLPGDVDRAYWASIFFCLGIWAFEAQMVIARVYFVLKDTITPTKVVLGMIALNLSLNLILVWPLREGGIALSTTIAAIIQGAILLFILRRRLGRLGLRALAGSVLRGLAATLLMVIVGLLLSVIPMPWEHGATAGGSLAIREKLLTALVKLPLLLCASGAVYLGFARALGMPEVSEVPLVGRFFRAKARRA